MTTFYVENFGCRATQADGAALEQQFREHGMVPAGSASEADVVLLNTCTVTAAADQDARSAIRRLHRQNPSRRIVVTGCYAQRAPEEIAALPGVSEVIGNSHKHELVEILSRESPAAFVPLSELSQDDRSAPIYVSDIFAHTELLAAPVFDAPNQRTRPNLKIQDGCDNRCSFCVIPSVRGHSRSMSLAQIIREINALVESGYREVVISGINLGRWGVDLEGNSSRLPHLIDDILERTALEKLRISSVEPMDWSDELIGLMAGSSRIAKHAHVPLQSASDTVLRRMHRKYRPWHYVERVSKIREAMPAAAIGADVMAGFPGETDAEFEETRSAVEELPFTYLHVFTYSARPGTPAAVMADQVPVPVARERNRVLRELAALKKLEFMRSFIGQEIEAITLNAGSGGFCEALTHNYLKLRLEGDQAPNRWIAARVHEVSGGMLLASKA